MISSEHKARARFFQDLHKGEGMLIIPNAWSVGSAWIFEKEGFQAVATSSAGLSYNLGYADGERMSFDELLYVVGKMTARLHIPLSVDFERGYSEDVQQVRDHAAQLLHMGVVGLNIEDGLSDGTLSPLELQLAKIRALAELKEELGLDFVINARTCAYWLNVAGDKQQIANSRCQAFREAGADCVFIPGPMDEPTVRSLVSSIDLPVNIIANAVFNDIDRLQAIGVKRLSVGSGPVRCICESTISMARQLRQHDMSAILKCGLSYKQANEYFAG